MNAPHWTAEDKHRVAALWSDEGRSAGDIAKEIGRSRNSVISIIARMKLPKRGKEVAAGNHLAAMKARQKPVPPKTEAKPPAKPKLVAQAAPKPKPKITPNPHPVVPLGLPLESLRLYGQCKFAITGDVPADQHLFCGLATSLDSAWCAHHRRVVFSGIVREREAA